MSTSRLILDYVFDHEAAQPDKVYLTQPYDGGKVIDYTWAETLDQARRMAAHLQTLGFERGARIAMLSKNCAHFFMAELAIWMAGGTTVAIFPTETSHTIRYVLEHSEASLLFVGKLDTFGQQASGIPAELPCIAFPLAPTTTFEAWDDIVARTQPMPGRPRREPDDLAMLMYTSGSTGQPKGVMHSFESITRASEHIVQHTESLIGMRTHGRSISYLPLAHVFERAWVECASMVSGKGQLFFAEALDTFLKDLQRARPTTFISVPRLWLKFQQGVLTKMPAEKLERLLRIPLVGRLVGRKVLKGLGLDQVLLAGSGSAPISAELIAWYRRLGLNLMEGYAMTEDFAYSHNSSPTLNEPGYVGSPAAGVEARIGEDGEILIKSPGQMIGYYKRPELNAECFTEDGFFRTGDRGEYRADGLLKITGRTKELFKTSKGKYIAPAPIENLLYASPLLEMAMVSGSGQRAPCALVVLAEELRPRMRDSIVRNRTENQLYQLLKEVNRELADYEQLQMLIVLPEPWTIENGCLTPTMKVKRHRIETILSEKMEACYQNEASVQWA